MSWSRSNNVYAWIATEVRGYQSCQIDEQIFPDMRDIIICDFYVLQKRRKFEEIGVNRIPAAERVLKVYQIGKRFQVRINNRRNLRIHVTNGDEIGKEFLEVRRNSNRILIPHIHKLHIVVAFTSRMISRQLHNIRLICIICYCCIAGV